MQKIKHMAAAIVVALCLISVAVILTLNFRPLYYLDMKLLNLSEKTGYSEEEIMDNYDTLIEYNSVFYKGDLEFPTLSMSEEGEIHFVEVKRIFTFFQAILFPVTLAASLFFIWNLRKQKPLYLKWASIFMVGIPTVLGILIAVNWDRFFVLFHEIMFNNDYWIFDPQTDPIIRLLPDAYFMHCAVMILALVVLFSVLCMIKYKGKRVRYGVLVCLVLALFSFIGCKNAVPDEMKAYSGKYVAMMAKSADYQMSVKEVVNEEVAFEASEHGTIQFSFDDKTEAGTWEIEDGKMHIQLEDKICSGILGENVIALEDLYGSDLVITFAKEGTEAANPVLYYPEEEQAVIGTWASYRAEMLLDDGTWTDIEDMEDVEEAFCITFAEDHTASFTYMGETVEAVKWGYAMGDCYMDGGNYHLCAYPVENEELTIDIYNGSMWYTFRCVRK